MAESVVDATANTIDPAKVMVVKVDSVDNVDSFRDANDSPRIFPRQQVSGVSRGVQQLGGPNLYADSGGGQIVASPGGVPRVLMGNQATFGEGFYVSKEGVDATTSTNSGDFIFNSNQNMFKIVNKIPTTVPAYRTVFGGTFTTGGATIAVPHGQTFTPLVDVYCQAELVNFSSGLTQAVSYIRLPLITAPDNSLSQYFFPAASGNSYGGTSVLYGADDTYVYIDAVTRNRSNTPDTMSVIPITIFVLQETAT